MDAICGAACESCGSRDRCGGCGATCGRPFGGACVAAEYIKTAGKERYAAFKRDLLNEINSVLQANGIPRADALYELPGSLVNLAYPTPGGETVKLLDDKKVYLGTQIGSSDPDASFGVVADRDFILVSEYRADGTGAELIVYQRRSDQKARCL